MAYELHGMLTGAVSMTTGDTVEPAYGGSHESFLSNVVTPIYEVIRKEAEKNKCGTADHTTWRNYDDLNEFFWSPDCFQIGWPMRLEHDFFCTSSPKKSKVKTSRSAREQRKEKETEDEEQGLNDVTSEENREPKWLGKTNFVEIRSFWQVFRSFDRMWSFFILSLQAMIIMACHDVGSPLEVFDAVILEDVMSIFITSAILKLIQVDLVLFFVPAVSKYIEISNWSICRTISRWTQPRLYVGRGMQETQISLFKYTFFWMLVLSTKLVFSYSFEIKPLIAPTREIMKIGVQTYDWHELFPKVRSNVGAIVAVWAPIIVVYFMDTQIWYSVYCTVCGGLYGILHHLGEVSKSEVLDQKFVLVWNQIISNFRSEDLISNREMDLMTIPTSGLFPEFIRWPIFLLANKVWVVSNIVNEIERSIEESTFLQDFKMSALPALQNKFVELLELIVEGDKNQNGKVVQVLQDIFELVTNDMMANGHRVVDLIECSQEAVDDFTFFSRKREPQLFESAASKTSICFPLPDDGPLTEQIQRLHLLLTVKDKAMDMPANLEARRRISFFATSLFMDMPSAPEVCSMMSFRTEAQVEPNLDEWKNFLERMGYQNFNELIDDEKEEEIRKWASFRGQTLSRTVRGIMYYRQALKLQALLEMPEYKAFIALIFFLVATCAYPDVVQDVNVFERNNPKSSAELDALVDMKFTYVVSCQMFGSHKSSGDPRAEDVKDLMIRYPALRVAYIEEKEEIIGDKPQKVYSSILAKAVGDYLRKVKKFRDYYGKICLVFAPSKMSQLEELCTNT
ncbi:Putative callose synthase 8 [Gossypium arboreum]|uniref:1,3-beta-glucan synthase n=1 Tax=Gossypium arboreum TaxID=29729 RepID=A0A0B0PEJ3_GOSAR|nr:Putative callose synthase 8 [Gossypium arboreum]